MAPFDGTLESQMAWATRLGLQNIGDLCYWNNVPGRTAAEVAARLRAAAFA